jgi:long-chain acyl-CoA synthetase
MAQLVARYFVALKRTGFSNGDRVAIQIKNGTDWVAFDIAAMAAGFIPVPLYAHDSLANTAHILENSGAKLIFLESIEEWRALAMMSAQFPAVKHVWIRKANAAGSSKCSESPIVRPLSEVLPSIASGTFCEPPLTPEATATLIYTSGTTGIPNGAMLSHFGILWNCEAIANFIPPLPDDVFLSLLPLAHAFERILGYYLAMMGGATVAFARSVKTLQEDLLAIRPTVFLAVPRIYERFYDTIQREAERNPIKAVLLHRAAKLGWLMHEAGQHRSQSKLVWRIEWPLLDRLIARRVRGAIGGRVRVAVSGGASLPVDTARFLIGLGLPLIEGYGLTEAGPVVTATSLDDYVPGSVGRPLFGLEIKLGEHDELLVRSPSIMKGYWRNGSATARAIDSDGWLRTGDIAAIRDGRVYIRGRLGERIALSTGEKVIAGALVVAIKREPLFEQACVIGEGRPYLTAIISLNLHWWNEFASKRGLDPQVPNSRDGMDMALRRIGELLFDFPAHAQIRGLHLVLEPWTVENGLLTPTLKVKRQAIEGKYRKEIDLLYGHSRQAREQLNHPSDSTAPEGPPTVAPRSSEH